MAGSNIKYLRTCALIRRSTSRTLTPVLVGVAMLVATVAVPMASAGQSLVRDEAHLKFVRSSGSQLIDEGPISGTIRGRARVQFTYTGDPNVAAALTIYTAHGSLGVRATGMLSSPTSPSPSFKGNLRIVSGTGRYAHASGKGELFGVFYRRTYAIVVQTIGKLRY
jgi:hypothetical protein